MAITEKASIFTIAQYGDLEAFKNKFLIKEINKKSEIGSGLLHYAIVGRNFDIALFLIQNNIDINMTNSDGQTALQYICVYQDLNVAEAILKHGVDINIRDKHGNNALWTAVFNCKGKNYDMVKLLMQYGPDIDTKNKARRSPIDFVTHIKDETLISILRG